MNKIQTLTRALATVFVALAAVPLQGHAQGDPGQFVSPPEGATFTYQRKSQGSYGNYDGPVTWTVGRRDWNGRALVSFASTTHGTQLLDPLTHSVAVQLNVAGQATYSYDPAIGYPWPLAVGKSWSTVHGMTMYKPPNTASLTYNGKVEALEDVTVPAGTFKAFKLVTSNSFGEVEQVWTAPALGISTVKRISDRPATHPLGAGHLEGVLTSRSTPAR